MEKIKKTILTIAVLLSLAPSVITIAEASGGAAAAAGAASTSAQNSQGATADREANNSLTKEELNENETTEEMIEVSEGQVAGRNSYRKAKQLIKGKNQNELETIIAVLEIEEIQGDLTDEEQIILDVARDELNSFRNIPPAFLGAIGFMMSIIFIYFMLSR